MTCLFLVLICVDYVLFLQAGHLKYAETGIATVTDRDLHGVVICVKSWAISRWFAGWNGYWKKRSLDTWHLPESKQHQSATRVSWYLPATAARRPASTQQIFEAYWLRISWAVGPTPHGVHIVALRLRLNSLLEKQASADDWESVYKWSCPQLIGLWW